MARILDVSAISMIVTCLLGSAVPIVLIHEDWESRQVRRAAWLVEGPPCPAPERPMSLASGRFPPKSFAFQGARFDRRHGYAFCKAFKESDFAGDEVYSVCQFSSPYVVQVQTEGRTHQFAPGAGTAVTITVRQGRVSCVVGGWWGRSNRYDPNPV